jgi:hypothetical protein
MLTMNIVCMLIAGYFGGMPLNPEEGCSMFILNVSEVLPDCTVSHPGRQFSVRGRTGYVPN